MKFVPENKYFDVKELTDFVFVPGYQIRVCTFMDNISDQLSWKPDWHVTKG